MVMLSLLVDVNHEVFHSYCKHVCMVIFWESFQFDKLLLMLKKATFVINVHCVILNWICISISISSLNSIFLYALPGHGRFQKLYGIRLTIGFHVKFSKYTYSSHQTAYNLLNKFLLLLTLLALCSFFYEIYFC